MKPQRAPTTEKTPAPGGRWWRRPPTDGVGRGDTPGAAKSEPSHDSVRPYGRTPLRLWPGRLWVRTEIRDPALRLAQEWILARGGRLVHIAPDLIAGKLPDGSLERYTCSAQRARQEQAPALLAPGAPDLQALVTAVAQRATGLALRLPAGRASPEALARGAFAPPAAECGGCGHGAGDDPAHPVCADCPLLSGRFVVVGARNAARAVTVEPRREDRSVEYTFKVSAGTPLGRREELVRFAVDAITGEQLAPLPGTLLRQASTAVDDAADKAALGPLARQLLARAEAHIEPVARAAARLARMQALPEYQRRQEDIETLYSHLLLEAPEHAAAALAARERELRQLAESLAVELDVRLVNAATVLSPAAQVRVRFAGGGDVTVDVDVGRGTVAPPRCAACGATWRVGARCANGHVTCLACHQQCAHCGTRRCARCATPPLAPCPICAAPSCERCARAAARGRHRVDVRAVQRASDPPDAALIAHAASGGPEDLTLADLDAMSPATWRACMKWLLTGLGYELERELSPDSDDDDLVALVCRRARDRLIAPPLALSLSAPLVVALGFRPQCAAALGEGDRARARHLAARVAGATPLLVTTAHAAPQSEWDGRRNAPVSALARANLAQLLAARAASYHRDRAEATVEADTRARQAAAVRAALIRGCHQAAALLRGGPTAARSPALADDGQSVAAPMAGLADAAQVARQALAALETLAEAWEALFGSVATRNGALTITADAAQLDDQRDQAEHLLGVLQKASATVGGAISLGDRIRDAWREAVGQELRLRCEALAARCEAIDPERWRSFAAAHSQEAAERSARAAAASRRAGARAEQLAGELVARATGAARGLQRSSSVEA